LGKFDEASNKVYNGYIFIYREMPKPKKPRKVSFIPTTTYFKPQGVPLSSIKEVNLTLDELEAVRLVDLEGLEQITAAGKMKISQSTLQRILKKARKKNAGALVEGKAIKVEGGEVVMPRLGRGVGRGRGRGRMGGPYAAGPLGICVCTNPECKKTAPHQAGVPCYQVKCPKCGSPMVRRP
jgi:predicted DNA-binding protein (UPF0251 family)